MIWMIAGHNIAPNTCRTMLASLFSNFRRPKRQLQHPQQAKHRPSSSHIPSMQSITQDDAGEAGDAKAAFLPEIRRPKRQLLHPQHAKHHRGHLQDDAGEARDAKAAFRFHF